MDIVAGFKKNLLSGGSRLQVSQPRQLLEDRHNYNIGAALWETVANTNGTVSHLPNESGVSMSIPGASGDKLTRQTFEHFIYTPSKPMRFEFACLFPVEDADLRTRVGAFTDDNGFFLEKDGATLNVVRRTKTSGSVVDNKVAQATWNADKLDGTGPSGKTLDLTKIQMVAVEYFWYGAGTARISFEVEGEPVIVHEFYTANTIATPSTTTGNLPIRYEIENTGATEVTSVLKTIDASVTTEGAETEDTGFLLSAEGTVTAGNGTRTHLLSIRPDTVFNSITNRIRWELQSVEVLVTGSAPVKWEIGYGHTLTTPSWTDVNTTYSGFHYDTTGTINAAPAIIGPSGYVASTNQVKGQTREKTKNILPICLTAAGAVRDLGTIGLFVTGIGNTSACRGIFNWREII